MSRAITSKPDHASNNFLEIKSIGKQAGGQIILRDINLSVQKGEFFSLLGPSGCGKTTLLRLIAGLDQPTNGEIWLNGNRVDGWAARERPFKMVFQKYALFPHLSVWDNVAFGPKLQKCSREEIQRRCERVLELVDLKSLAHRRPETLSGGQSQRVAVARAIVNEPQVLLLDEPLSALDQKMREHMQGELRDLQKNLGLTFVYVTHDQEEALVLSDRIGVMSEGRIEQVASPRQIYDDPKTFFVASFVGQMSKLTGQILQVEAGQGQMRLGCGDVIKGLRKDSSQTNLGTAFVRPERMVVRNSGETSTFAEGSHNTLSGTILTVRFRGSDFNLEIDCGQGTLVRAGGVGCRKEWRVGTPVQVDFAIEDTWFFSDDRTPLPRSDGT